MFDTCHKYVDERLVQLQKKFFFFFFWAWHGLLDIWTTVCWQALPVRKGEIAPSLRASQAHWEGFKIGMKGIKLGLLETSLGGMIMGLWVNWRAQLKHIYAKACRVGNKQEELEAIMQ